jgi:hypothetical protein
LLIDGLEPTTKIVSVMADQSLSRMFELRAKLKEQKEKFDEANIVLILSLSCVQQKVTTLCAKCGPVRVLSEPSWARSVNQYSRA